MDAAKASDIKTIIAKLPHYAPESVVYQRFEAWLSKQSMQNVWLIKLIATNN